MLKDQLALVEEKIQKACERSGRNREDVTLIAVSKTKPVEMLQEAYDLGIRIFGENKVQELTEKYELLPKDIQWHLIGHLQTNKVKYIIDKVFLIHSVDSLKLAKEIDKRAKEHGKVMDILIQVNSAAEESKFGISSDEVEKMILEILESYDNICIRGLMCIAPYAENPDDVRNYFAEVKELYDKFKNIEHERLDFKYLSMGMSNDYKVAMEEGSNLVRVGSAIFGRRTY